MIGGWDTKKTDFKGMVGMVSGVKEPDRRVLKGAVREEQRGIVHSVGHRAIIRMGIRRGGGNIIGFRKSAKDNLIRRCILGMQ